MSIRYPYRESILRSGQSIEIKEQEKNSGKKYATILNATHICFIVGQLFLKYSKKETLLFQSRSLKAEKKKNLIFLLFPIVFLFEFLGLVFRLVWYFIFITGVPILFSIWILYYFETEYGVVNGLSYTCSIVLGLLMFIILKKIMGCCEVEDYFETYHATVNRKVIEAKKQYMAFFGDSNIQL